MRKIVASCDITFHAKRPTKITNGQRDFFGGNHRNDKRMNGVSFKNSTSTRPTTVDYFAQRWSSEIADIITSTSHTRSWFNSADRYRFITLAASSSPCSFFSFALSLRPRKWIFANQYAAHDGQYRAHLEMFFTAQIQFMFRICLECTAFDLVVERIRNCFAVVRMNATNKMKKSKQFGCLVSHFFFVSTSMRSVHTNWTSFVTEEKLLNCDFFSSP